MGVNRVISDNEKLRLETTFKPTINHLHRDGVRPRPQVWKIVIAAIICGVVPLLLVFSFVWSKPLFKLPTGIPFPPSLTEMTIPLAALLGIGIRKWVGQYYRKFAAMLATAVATGGLLAVFLYVSWASLSDPLVQNWLVSKFISATLTVLALAATALL